jgi:c-di-GMP-binding flagellar brake protein YcgR
MAVLVAAGTKAVRRLLQAACARNTSAELHCEGDEGSLTARLRLLRVESQQLLTDEARFSGNAPALRPRQPVVIYFLQDGVRWAFRSRVRAPQVVVSLNHDFRIRGMAFQVPDQVLEQQRRADFRVSLAGRDILAELRAAATGDITACPVHADRFAGRVTNISAGGLCLLVDPDVRSGFDLGELFYAHFRLPEEDEECLLPVEVRNHRRIASSGAILVGLRFVACSLAGTPIQLRRVQHFVAAEQRRLLRARRV